MDCSIIIKTFERYECLRRLLCSIQKHAGNEYRIIIADDSKTPYKEAIIREFGKLCVDYITLEFDSGLSVGRNAMLDQVSTEFFVLCDDDFVFDRRTDLVRMRELLCVNECDILGGECYDIVPLQWGLIRERIRSRHLSYLLRIFDRRGGRPRRYFGRIEGDKKKGQQLMMPLPYQAPVTICDYCCNFFIARTSSVRKIGGWNPALKVGEHEDFFFRAKKHGLVIGHTSEIGVNHLQYLPEEYRPFRARFSKWDGTISG